MSDAGAVRNYAVFVGTFTAEFTAAGGGSMGEGALGVSVFRLDGRTGGLTHRQTLPGMISPSFLTVHPVLPVLYTVERQLSATDDSAGAVTVFTIGDDGTLAARSRRDTGGKWPSHVSAHPAGRQLYVANIASGRVTSFELNDTGDIVAHTATLQHEGHGAHAFTGDPRSGPRTHCAVPDPTGRFLLVCDLGSSRLTRYPTDPATGTIQPGSLSTLDMTSAGPRHAAWHPTLPVAYVANEVDSTMSVVRFDPDSGAMTHTQCLPTVPPGVTDSHCADVHVDPKGRFVHVSNRGHDSLTSFAVDPASGAAVEAGHQPSLGVCPRNFTYTPDGEFVLVANQRSAQIVVFRRDPETGRLDDTGQRASTPTPVSLALHPMP